MIKWYYLCFLCAYIYIYRFSRLLFRYALASLELAQLLLILVSCLRHSWELLSMLLVWICHSSIHFKSESICGIDMQLNSVQYHVLVILAIITVRAIPLQFPTSSRLPDFEKGVVLQVCHYFGISCCMIISFKNSRMIL